MSGHRIGVVVFDGVKLLDVAGPMEVFAEANRIGDTSYELMAVGEGEVTSSTGLAINVDADFTVDLDTVLVAGGDRLVGRAIEPELVGFVRDLAERTPRVCSICTGAFVLAAAGVLDGRCATTHWQHARLLAASYPRITVEPDAIWVQDGQVFTSAVSRRGSTWRSLWSRRTAAASWPGPSPDHSSCSCNDRAASRSSHRPCRTPGPGPRCCARSRTRSRPTPAAIIRSPRWPRRPRSARVTWPGCSGQKWASRPPGT
jgi:putative intracellular protease/amidase